MEDIRWRRAQLAEGSYWSGFSQSEELQRHLCEQQRHLAQIAVRLLAKYCNIEHAHIVEVGIGPLGIGIIPFLPRDLSSAPVRIGIEPLPRMKVPLTESIPTAAFVQAKGENLPLRDGFFQAAICYNVLDHCDYPLGVVREIARVMDWGGILYLSVDVFSLLSAAKRMIVEYLRPNAFNTILHPHVFLERPLLRLLVASGFLVLERWPQQSKAIRLLWTVLGRTRRLTYVAKKV